MTNSSLKVNLLSNTNANNIRFSGNNSVSSPKNSEAKDTFVSQHKKAIIITSSVVGAAGLLTGAFFLARSGKLGSSLQNFTNKLTGKASNAAQELSKTDAAKPISTVEAAISLDSELNPLERAAEVCEELGNMSNDMLKLYGGKGGVQRARMMVRDEKITDPLDSRAISVTIKAHQLSEIFTKYKKVQAQADTLYEEALAYIKKLPQEKQEESLKILNARIGLIRKPHENAQVYDRIIEAIASGDFFANFLS